MHFLLDGFCYAAQPQEHASDNQSLIETPAALGQTVQSARSFAPQGNVCVGPITLRKQVNPYGEPPSQRATESQIPPTVDARQSSLLGAAWSFACLKYLAEAGAVASTWYEIAGWKGLFMPSPPALPFEQHRLFPAKPGMVYPLFHVLADWNELQGGKFLGATSSNRLKVECILVEDGSRKRLLLANMQGRSRLVRLPFVASTTWLRRLNSQTFRWACSDPIRFRQEREKTNVPKTTFFV